MKLHIIAAVVDTRELTLYLKDGSTQKIPQGDKRLAKILEEITPQLVKNKEAFYEEEAVPEGDYVEFEGRTNGIVKFFKIAKSKLEDFLATMNDDPAPPVEPVELNLSSAEDKLSKAVAEIIQSAEPVTTNSVGEDHNIVAIVGDRMVPHAEALVNQVVNSNENKTKGLENFMKRVANVAAKRMHSVQDLMKFMERGDLPIAEDGSIIIYKVLKRSPNKDHSYVDCHTKLVPQSVGSYVCMDESLVDPNRNNECSNGLHVARRGYIKSFSGDVCVLAKVAPEDVIAVPKYDANKMRVAGYHILFELPAEAYEKLRRDVSMTDNPTGKVLLGKAMVGDHVGKLEETRIGGHLGTKITFKKLMPEYAAEVSMTANIITSVDAMVESINTEISTDNLPKAKTVAPLDVAKDLVTTKDTLKNITSRAEKAKILFDAYKLSSSEDDYATLVEFKTKCKCSWATLELPDMSTKTERNPDKKEKSKATTPVTRTQKVAAMLKNIKAAKGEEKIKLANELLDFKKKCRTGFDVLGLNKKDTDLIMRLTKK